MAGLELAAATVARIARQAAGRDVPAAWTAEPLGYGALNPVSAGLYRVAGKGWSVVLKVIQPAATPGNDTPSDKDYWRREALAYRSGLLGERVGGWAAARAYEVEERPDGRLWLWLEDLGPPGPWSAERHRLAALHFGHLAGRFAGRPLAEPWLCRGFLRSWLDIGRRDGFFAPLRDPRVMEHPRVRKALGEGDAGRLLAVEAGGHALAEALEALPQTLCHHDPGRPNTFARRWPSGRDETVSIDFGFLGLGAVGEDLGTMVGGHVAALEVEPDAADAHLRASFEAYLDGLAETGWRGDSRHVELAALGAAGLRHTVFAGFALAGLAKDEPDGWLQAWFARSGGEAATLERSRAATRWLLGLFERARRLA